MNDSATNVALEVGNTVNNARNSDVIEVSGHGAVALESTVAAANGYSAHALFAIPSPFFASWI